MPLTNLNIEISIPVGAHGEHNFREWFVEHFTTRKRRLIILLLGRSWELNQLLNSFLEQVRLCHLWCATFTASKNYFFTHRRLFKFQSSQKLLTRRIF